MSCMFDYMFSTTSINFQVSFMVFCCRLSSEKIHDYMELWQVFLQAVALLVTHMPRLVTFTYSWSFILIPLLSEFVFPNWVLCEKVIASETIIQLHWKLFEHGLFKVMPKHLRLI